METSEYFKNTMSKDELITKQQLIIEDYKQKSEDNKDVLKTIGFRFNGIGQPLNDNVLKMNSDQLQWVYGIKELIGKIE